MASVVGAARGLDQAIAAHNLAAPNSLDEVHTNTGVCLAHYELQAALTALDQLDPAKME
ncbi:hypothetical protein DA2_0742, partial [Desulfovibrio sp. A2]